LRAGKRHATALRSTVVIAYETADVWVTPEHDIGILAVGRRLDHVHGLHHGTGSNRGGGRQQAKDLGFHL
jgi:hypothetical protein